MLLFFLLFIVIPVFAVLDFVHKACTKKLTISCRTEQVRMLHGQLMVTEAVLNHFVGHTALAVVMKRTFVTEN